MSPARVSRPGRLSECCGGAGSPEAFHRDVDYVLAKHDIDRAVEVEANVLIAACQTCERALRGAVRGHPEARRTRMRVVHVVEPGRKAMDEVKDEEGR